MTRRLRAAVVGCGTIGPRHGEAYQFHPDVDLVAAVDLVGERAELFSSRYGATRHYTSTAAMLADARPDLVSVATPPGTHAELAEQILAAGVDVLLEKPPTPTLAELDRVAAAEASSRGRAYVVFQHRHGSGARRAHRLLADGGLGSPRVVVCETLWFRPRGYFDPDWRGTWAGEGGGPTLGHGIHQLDLMLHLVGPWRSLSALTVRLDRPVQFEDVSAATISFDNGAVGTIVNSLLSPKELSRLRIDTTDGTLEVRHVYGYSDDSWSYHRVPAPAVAATLGVDPGVRDGSGSLAPRVADPAADPWLASADENVPSNHGAQINRLVGDLLADRVHETTLASTRPTIELVTAFYASGLTGRAVSRAELVPGHPFYDSLSGGLGQADIDRLMAQPVTTDPKELP